MVNIFSATDRRSIASVDTAAKLLGADPATIKTDGSGEVAAVAS
jgi:hypothetical protein